jgi:hypothetical protein
MQTPEYYAEEGEPRQKVSGGHMLYDRSITSDGPQKIFTKKHDPTLFTDDEKERHSREYLAKEQHLYAHLASQDFVHIPNQVDYRNNALSMEGLDVSDGWLWRAPDDSTQYIEDILAVLSSLQYINLPEEFRDSGKPTYATHKEEGWEALEAHSSADIQRHIRQIIPTLKPAFVRSAIELSERFADLSAMWSTYIPTNPSFVLSHHDARQANIAWHPTHGVRVVDWSWAGHGEVKSDTTMFLIDLHKSGHDISPYIEAYATPSAALLQTGFLLNHSLWPSRSSTDTTRTGQLISAISAYDIWRTYDL